MLLAGPTAPVIVGYALGACLECCEAEIHQDAEWQVHKPQLGGELLCVNRGMLLGRLQLDDKPILHKQINLECVVYDNAFVSKEHRHLPPAGKVSVCNRSKEEQLIDTF